jgi:hypothetical protein
VRRLAPFDLAIHVFVSPVGFNSGLGIHHRTGGVRGWAIRTRAQCIHTPFCLTRWNRMMGRKHPGTKICGMKISMSDRRRNQTKRRNRRMNTRSGSNPSRRISDIEQAPLMRDCGSGSLCASERSAYCAD